MLKNPVQAADEHRCEPSTTLFLMTLVSVLLTEPWPSKSLIAGLTAA